MLGGLRARTTLPAQMSSRIVPATRRRTNKTPKITMRMQWPSQASLPPEPSATNRPEGALVGPPRGVNAMLASVLPGQ
eukprot:scaffold1658_cov105-Pinguiococcus_pyrenoidosus.AAC.1